METTMEPDDYIVTTNVSSIVDATSWSLDDYMVDTIDISSLSGITITTSEEYSSRRLDVRDNGKIPIDIWAKLFNNGVIDD
jgi:hypothetical protein